MENYKKIKDKLEKIIISINKIEGELDEDAKGYAIVDALQDAILKINAAIGRCDMPITYFERPIRPEGTPKKIPPQG